MGDIIRENVKSTLKQININYTIVGEDVGVTFKVNSWEVVSPGGSNLQAGDKIIRYCGTPVAYNKSNVLPRTPAQQPKPLFDAAARELPSARYRGPNVLFFKQNDELIVERGGRGI